MIANIGKILADRRITMLEIACPPGVAEESEFERGGEVSEPLERIRQTQIGIETENIITVKRNISRWIKRLTCISANATTAFNEKMPLIAKMPRDAGNASEEIRAQHFRICRAENIIFILIDQSSRCRSEVRAKLQFHFPSERNKLRQIYFKL